MDKRSTSSHSTVSSIVFAKSSDRASFASSDGESSWRATTTTKSPITSNSYTISTSDETSYGSIVKDLVPRFRVGADKLALEPIHGVPSVKKGNVPQSSAYSDSHSVPTIPHQVLDLEARHRESEFEELGIAVSFPVNNSAVPNSF